MIGGIDLGGTKIEARLFDARMNEVMRHRIATPTESYDALLQGMLTQIRWLEEQGEVDAIGLGAPGLIHPETGVMLTANLPATGKAMETDISALAGREIPITNDCRAFTLSEACHGAGIGYKNVAGLIIGTGVAGGHVVNGALLSDKNGQHGEFGHLPLSAEVAAMHDLPLISCGCGLTGCFETFLSGPGLVRLARLKTGRELTTHGILSDPKLDEVRQVWVDIAAALVAILARTIDPEIVILGGGLGSLPQMPEWISGALDGKLLGGTVPPVLAQAKHGDASGALGAALYAQARLRGESA